MSKIIDLRSDTVTQPTQSMRLAMMEAQVGDDILGDDPTVRQLESLAAEMFGKEAGLFVISGTMANQVALQTLTQRGDEVLVGEETHIYNLEVGGLAALSGIQVKLLKSSKGRFDLDDIRLSVRSKGIQSPITRVLCLENTYDLNRGIPLPADYISLAAKIAHENDLTVYLDGARIFNAAVVHQETLADLCKDVDALQFCLSKGLAAPVGSLLLGSQDFIDKARWIRQRIGGGMRQAGHMAAAGIIALETMVNRLAQDHANAMRLALGMKRLDPTLVNVEETLSNIVRIDFKHSGKSSTQIALSLELNGIKVKQVNSTCCRMVSHHGITEADIDYVVHTLESILYE